MTLTWPFACWVMFYADDYDLYVLSVCNDAVIDANLKLLLARASPSYASISVSSPCHHVLAYPGIVLAST
jgi:hypothetical protein